METNGAVVLKIRQKVADGSLPCEPHPKTWAGPGRDAPCDGCDQQVLPTEVEFEVDVPGGRVLRFHRLCFGVWQAECEELERK